MSREETAPADLDDFVAGPPRVIGSFGLREGAIVAACAAYVIWCWARMPAQPILTSDSPEYLAFAPTRTLGYPLMVLVLGARTTTFVQPLLYGASLAWLALETLWLTSRIPPAIAVVAGAMAIPDLTTYHASLLTESTFMSASIALVAATLRFLRAPAPGRAVVAGALAGVATAIRPTGVALLPALLVATVAGRRGPHTLGARIVAAVLPFALLAGGERVAATWLHGSELTTLTGKHFFAKAALIDAPSSPSPPVDALRASLEARLDATGAPVRAVLRAAPPDVRGVLTLYYELCFQGGACVPELSETPPWGNRALNDLLTDLALTRIARAPLGFLALTATEYRSLWTVLRLRQPDVAAHLATFFAAHRPLPFEREALALGAADQLTFAPPLDVLRIVQPLVTAAGWMTGMAALLGLAACVRWRFGPVAAAACSVSLAAHGPLLFTAVFALGTSRYAMTSWPIAVAGLVLCVSAVLFRQTRTGPDPL